MNELGDTRLYTGSVSAARQAALEVLLLVEDNRGHSDELLHGRHLKGLSQADKNLTTALVMGVLRWQIALDARVHPLLQRPDSKLAAPVAMALRLGALQLLHMDRIPAHAALSESVELVKLAGHPYAAGMVNAVLRKVATAPKPGTRLHESTAAFAERLGHPAWLAQRWEREYGRAAALAICEAGQQEPECAEIFAAEADGYAMPLMDAGSRLVAELAASCAPDAQRVWDCCAAPGGKTLVLAHRLPQAEILATDASPRRLRALTERMEQAGAKNVRTAEADAGEANEDLGEFDLVFCDVPCTGTGTLARNPEIRHRLAPAEISRQAKRQREILKAASARVRTQGRLVYATCSLEREENEAVVEEFLHSAAGAKWKRRDVGELLRGLPLQAEEAARESWLRQGALRTLAGRFPGDGFFAVVLERV